VTITKTNTKIILSKIYQSVKTKIISNKERTLDESSMGNTKIDQSVPLKAEGLFGKGKWGVYCFDDFIEDLERLSENEEKEGYDEI